VKVKTENPRKKKDLAGGRRNLRSPRGTEYTRGTTARMEKKKKGGGTRRTCKEGDSNLKSRVVSAKDVRIPNVL